MKRTIAAIVLMAVTVLGCYGDEAVTKKEGNSIRLSFADKEIIVSMTDNRAARSLLEMLPLTLKFQDYAGSEKISYPPEDLDTSDVPAGYDPSVGDLTLYAAWGDLAFLYRDHGYARGLVPLGTIVSGSEFLGEMDSAAAVHVETSE
jgi:hypothetical protein